MRRNGGWLPQGDTGGWLDWSPMGLQVMPPAHVPVEKLMAFNGNHLGEDESRTVLAHLQSCTHCDKLFRSVVVRAVRSVVAAEAPLCACARPNGQPEAAPGNVLRRRPTVARRTRLAWRSQLTSALLGAGITTLLLALL